MEKSHSEAAYARHDVATATSCAVREAATICPRPMQFDLLTLKVVFESRVTWATSVPILLFLGLSVLDLGPMYETDRQMSDICQKDVRRASSLNASALWGRGIISQISQVK